jgi:HSP20 family protein
MEMTRWDAFQELAEFQRTVDRMLGRRSRRVSYGYPPIDLIDAGDAYVLSALLPGCQSDQIKLTVFENSITLEGSRAPTIIESARVIRRERPYGQFQKRIDLPGPVREEEVDAQFANGVLQVTLPKRRLTGPLIIQIK